MYKKTISISSNLHNDQSISPIDPRTEELKTWISAICNPVNRAPILCFDFVPHPYDNHAFGPIVSTLNQLNTVQSTLETFKDTFTNDTTKKKLKNLAETAGEKEIKKFNEGLTILTTLIRNLDKETLTRQGKDCINNTIFFLNVLKLTTFKEFVQNDRSEVFYICALLKPVFGHNFLKSILTVDRVQRPIAYRSESQVSGLFLGQVWHDFFLEWRKENYIGIEDFGGYTWADSFLYSVIKIIKSHSDDQGNDDIRKLRAYMNLRGIHIEILSNLPPDLAISRLWKYANTVDKKYRSFHTDYTLALLPFATKIIEKYPDQANKIIKKFGKECQQFCSDVDSRSDLINSKLSAITDTTSEL